VKAAAALGPIAAALAAAVSREAQAKLRHDQEPFVRVLARAEELERARWPVQGDPGDERPSDEGEEINTLEELVGPFGRLALERFKL
jgi:hypothetical protein